MRDLSTEMQDAVSARAVMPVLMAQFKFDSQDVNIWSGVGVLTWNFIDFQGGGVLVGVSPYNETQSLEAQGFTFTVTGVPSSILSATLLESYQGRACSLWLAMAGVDTSILYEDGGQIMYEDGGYMVAENNLLPEPYKIFSGIMDVMTFEDNGQEATIQISAENAMIVLTQTREGRFTSEDQKSRFPDDTGLDFVTSIQDQEIIWKAKN